MPRASPFLDGYLPYLLRQADQTLSEPFYGVLSQRGVGRSEWRVLAVLHERGALPVVELASAALSPQPTVTHAVRRLEDRGLVARSNGPDDRRQRIVAITPQGRTLTTELIAEASRLERELLAGIDGRDQLIAALRHLTSQVQQASTGGDTRTPFTHPRSTS